MTFAEGFTLLDQLAKSSFRLILFVALFVGFCLIWCGLMVHKAIDEGVLKSRNTICLDARHLYEMVRGDVSQNRVDSTIRQQIYNHYYPFSRRGGNAWVRNGAALGLSVFWSPEERRALYNKIEPNMRPCSGAVARLKGYRETGKWWYQR